MRDIKKIYVCGGSQCIGAGFIWKDVKKIYKEYHDIDIDNHLDFAYPNILAKKLNADIINEGAPGGSVTRMLRKTYDYLLENYSTIKETLVILEVPPGWREELNSIDLGRTINMTVGNILSPDDETDVACGNNKKDTHKIHKDATTYFNSFVDYYFERDKWMANLVGLVSFLKLNDVQHIIMDSGDLDYFLKRKKVNLKYNFVWFSDSFERPMGQWAEEEKLLIKHETSGLSNDEHMGIRANQMVADKLYKMITNENQSSVS